MGVVTISGKRFKDEDTIFVTTATMRTDSDQVQIAHAEALSLTYVKKNKTYF